MNNIVNHDQGYVEMSSCGDESDDVLMDLMDAHDFIANGHWERPVFTN